MARSVERWLETFMCGQYAETFEAYGYKTLQSVCQLDYQYLRGMGVLPEHCEKIMENVSVLRQSYMAKSTGPPAVYNGMGSPMLTSASSALAHVARNSASRGSMGPYGDGGPGGGGGGGGANMAQMNYPQNASMGGMGASMQGYPPGGAGGSGPGFYQGQMNPNQMQNPHMSPAQMHQGQMTHGTMPSMATMSRGQLSQGQLYMQQQQQQQQQQRQQQQQQQQSGPYMHHGNHGNMYMAQQSNQPPTHPSMQRGYGNQGNYGANASGFPNAGYNSGSAYTGGGSRMNNPNSNMYPNSNVPNSQMTSPAQMTSPGQMPNQMASPGQMPNQMASPGQMPNQMASPGQMPSQMPNQIQRVNPPLHSPTQPMQSPNQMLSPSSQMGMQTDSSVTPTAPPQHAHMRNTTSQNPQQVADSILQMASTAYQANGPAIIPSGMAKYRAMGPCTQMPATHAQHMMPNTPGTATYGLRNQNPVYMGYPSAMGMQGNRSSPMSPMQVQSPASVHSNHSLPSTSPGPMCSPPQCTERSPGSVPSPSVKNMRSPPSSCQQSIQSPMNCGPMPNQSNLSCTPNQPSPGMPNVPMQSPPHAGHYSPSHMPMTSGHSVMTAGHASPVHYAQCTKQNYPDLGSNQQVANYSNMNHSTPHYNSNNQASAGYSNVNQPPQSYAGGNQPTQGPGGIHNPLQSLQKLVMLPESQVVDPKSVVNDACLPGTESNNTDDESKNGVGTDEVVSLRRCSDGIHCGSDNEAPEMDVSETLPPQLKEQNAHTASSGCPAFTSSLSKDNGHISCNTETSPSMYVSETAKRSHDMPVTNVNQAPETSQFHVNNSTVSSSITTVSPSPTNPSSVSTSLLTDTTSALSTTARTDMNPPPTASNKTESIEAPSPSTTSSVSSCITSETSTPPTTSTVSTTVTTIVSSSELPTTTTASYHSTSVSDNPRVFEKPQSPSSSRVESQVQDTNGDVACLNASSEATSPNKRDDSGNNFDASRTHHESMATSTEQPRQSSNEVHSTRNHCVDISNGISKMDQPGSDLCNSDSSGVGALAAAAETKADGSPVEKASIVDSLSDEMPSDRSVAKETPADDHSTNEKPSDNLHAGGAQTPEIQTNGQKSPAASPVLSNSDEGYGEGVLASPKKRSTPGQGRKKKLKKSVKIKNSNNKICSQITKAESEMNHVKELKSVLAQHQLSNACHNDSIVKKNGISLGKEEKIHENGPVNGFGTSKNSLFDAVDMLKCNPLEHCHGKMPNGMSSVRQDEIVVNAITEMTVTKSKGSSSSDAKSHASGHQVSEGKNGKISENFKGEKLESPKRSRRQISGKAESKSPGGAFNNDDSSHMQGAKGTKAVENGSLSKTELSGLTTPTKHCKNNSDLGCRSKQELKPSPKTSPTADCSPSINNSLAQIAKMNANRECKIEIAHCDREMPNRTSIRLSDAGKFTSNSESQMCRTSPSKSPTKNNSAIKSSAHSSSLEVGLEPPTSLLASRRRSGGRKQSNPQHRDTAQKTIENGDYCQSPAESLTTGGESCESLASPLCDEVGSDHSDGENVLNSQDSICDTSDLRMLGGMPAERHSDATGPISVEIPSMDTATPALRSLRTGSPRRQASLSNKLCPPPLQSALSPPITKSKTPSKSKRISPKLKHKSSPEFRMMPKRGTSPTEELSVETSSEDVSPIKADEQADETALSPVQTLCSTKPVRKRKETTHPNFFSLGFDSLGDNSDSDEEYCLPLKKAKPSPAKRTRSQDVSPSKDSKSGQLSPGAGSSRRGGRRASRYSSSAHLLENDNETSQSGSLEIDCDQTAITKPKSEPSSDVKLEISSPKSMESESGSLDHEGRRMRRGITSPRRIRDLSPRKSSECILVKMESDLSPPSTGAGADLQTKVKQAEDSNDSDLSNLNISNVKNEGYSAVASCSKYVPSSTLPPQKKRGRPVGSKNSPISIKKNKQNIKQQRTHDGQSEPTLQKKKNTLKSSARKKYGKKSFYPPVEDGQEDFGGKLMKTLNIIKNCKNKVRTVSPVPGPLVRIYGPKDNPRECKVVNMNDQESDKSSKKRKGHYVTAYEKQAAEQCAKIPVSDSVPWTCAFCGKESNYSGLGDLFGPYFPDGYARMPASPHKNVDRSCDSNKQSADAEMQSDRRRTKRRRTDSSGDSSEVRSRRLSSKSCDDNVASSHGGHVPSEIWVHVNCAIWAHGVHIGGGNVTGLEEAVAVADQTVCSVCKNRGATIGCYTKACGQKYHYLCAVEKHCYFDEENFSLICPKHKMKK